MQGFPRGILALAEEGFLKDLFDGIAFLVDGFREGDIGELDRDDEQVRFIKRRGAMDAKGLHAEVVFVGLGLDIRKRDGGDAAAS